jgi:hypothetical protein
MRYFLCQTEADYARCEAVRQAYGVAPHPWQHPTMAVERDGQLIGYLGSYTTEDGEVVLGPLVIDRADPIAKFIVARLEVYILEVLGLAGLHYVTISVPVEEQTYLGYLTRRGWVLWAMQAGEVWLRKLLRGNPYERTEVPETERAGA